MTKKTSKTSHVLNVLTSHNGEDEFDPSEDAPGISSSEPMAPVQVPAAETPPNQTPIAELKPAPVSTPDIVPQTAEISEQIKAKLAEEARAFLEGNFSPSSVVNGNMNNQDENRNVQAPSEEYEYFYVNILEGIVQERVLQMLKQNHQCMCNTCVNDAIAFALNQLPAKYVVTTKGGLFVQASLYEKQYLVDIISAATQGCMRVGEHPNPEHNMPRQNR